MIPSFLTGYITGIATLWAFLEVISFAAVRRVKRSYACPGAVIESQGDGDWLAPYRKEREPDMADITGIGGREPMQPMYMYGVTGIED
jgi:hypothetical protein